MGDPISGIRCWLTLGSREDARETSRTADAEASGQSRRYLGWTCCFAFVFDILVLYVSTTLLELYNIFRSHLASDSPLALSVTLGEY